MKRVAKARRIVALTTGSLLLVFGCATSSLLPSPDRVAISDGWLAMGTFFEVEIRLQPGEEDRARAWIEWARTEIARLEHVYSRHDPDSAVSQLNRALESGVGVGETLRIPEELESILLSAVEIWDRTGGAFDITVGPLVDVWTDAAQRGEWPTISELRTAKSHVGSDGLALLGNGELHSSTDHIRIDLDGISKGAALDRLRERFLIDLPGAAALLSFGQSSIVAIGDPDGDGWRVEIRSRNPVDTDLGTLRLRNKALSVSSSLGSEREIAGERVSHIIDPRTGGVVAETVEAIVIADDARIADGWSTALLVIGADRTALRMVRQAGLEASVLESSGRSVTTEGWEGALIGRFSGANSSL